MLLAINKCVTSKNGKAVDLKKYHKAKDGCKVLLGVGNSAKANFVYTTSAGK